VLTHASQSRVSNFTMQLDAMKKYNIAPTSIRRAIQQTEALDKKDIFQWLVKTHTVSF
jgi:hypothetical protein